MKRSNDCSTEDDASGADRSVTEKSSPLRAIHDRDVQCLETEEEPMGGRSCFCGASVTLLLIGAYLMADDRPPVLFAFTGADAVKEWQTVNDGVMGGVSEGKFRISDRKTLEFFGTLSLENNGGFASVRSRVRKLGLNKGDTLVARVRGDGREYSMNLYVPRPLVAFSYRATLPTKKDEWIEVELPLEMFQATSFGRVVKEAGAVKPEEIHSVGFLLGDKKAGAFKLEIEWIKVVRAKP
jgi:monofunctional biosynthetic peptidoglycan transglycosylase